jgi:hypothetical protein
MWTSATWQDNLERIRQIQARRKAAQLAGWKRELERAARRRAVRRSRQAQDRWMDAKAARWLDSRIAR